MFSLKYTSENCSVIPALVNTILITLLALLVSVPLGVGSAIYLVEYAKKDNKFVKVVRMTTETLTGIPSIIYGLFGMLLFVGFFKWGYSILAGSFTVAIMILPTVINMSETALKAVDPKLKSASMALGASHMETIFKVLLPAAKSGILAGVVLGIGRALGEAMAITLVSGSSVNLPLPFNSVRFLTTAIVSEMGYAGDLHRQVLFTIGLILFVFIMLINIVLEKVIRRDGR